MTETGGRTETTTDEESRGARIWRQIERVVFIGVLIFAGSRLGPQIAAAVGVQRDLGRMPAFSVESLDGDIVSPEALRGKVVLVNFWATWCGPCRVEMPGFQKVYEDLKGEGFVILGLATDREGRGVVQRYVEERGVTYPIALSSNRLEQDFGGLRGLPMSYLVDRSGVIRHRVFGFFASPTLRLAVGHLLEEEAVPASAHVTESRGSGVPGVRTEITGGQSAKRSP